MDALPSFPVTRTSVSRRQPAVHLGAVPGFLFIAAANIRACTVIHVSLARTPTA